MKSRNKWGVIALTAALMTPLAWQGVQPFGHKARPHATPHAAAQTQPPHATPPTTQSTPRTSGARLPDHTLSSVYSDERAFHEALRAKKLGGNERTVAKDVARTASLCVRDCRTMLTQMTHELSRARTADERQRILNEHMKMHPQFVSLTVTDRTSGAQLSAGRTLRPDLHDQARPYVLQDNFYVSDLYALPGAKDPKEQIGMTLGVPIVGDKNVIGALTADVEMGHMMQVIRNQNEEMGTSTALSGLDGYNEALRGRTQQTKGGTRTEQVTAHTAESKIDGTAWRVRVSGSHTNGPRHQGLVRDEVVVRFDRALTDAELNDMAAQIKGNLVRRNARNTYIFHSDVTPQADIIAFFRSRGARLAEAHSRARQNEFHVEANQHRVIEQPNDTFYSSHQWNLPLIHADKAWQATTGDPAVVIAVVDTGVDLNHPDLKGKLVEGYNVLTGSNNPQDDNGHGTHCAGIIAARTNNTEGIAGVDWGSKIMPIKAMAADGTGSVVDIADGVIWAVDHGASIINLSLGDYNDSEYLHDAIRYATAKGASVFAAMGNDGVEDPSFPAAYEECIAVAANDENTETASFSNFGAHTSVSAPGVAIPSTYPNQRYVALSGTSMATPHVAGVAGLLKSVNPKLTPADIRKILESTADDLGPEGKDEYYGYGQINVAKAVAAAKPE